MTELYTRRNISECLGAAWTLISTNLQRIAKTLWLPSVVYSITYAAVAVGKLTLHANDMLVLGIGIICLAAQLAIMAKAVKLLNEQNFKFNISRSIKVFLFVMAFILLALALAGATGTGVAMLAKTGKASPAMTKAITLFAICVVAIAVLVFLSPFSYTLTKYLIEPESKIKGVFKNYRTGFRSLGFIIGCNILCAIMMSIVSCIVGLPGYIATAATTLSNLGVANGDPAGLPANFALMFGATMFIVGFVDILLQIWFLFASYYMYASIEARNGRTDFPEEKTDTQEEQQNQLFETTTTNG